MVSLVNSPADLINLALVQLGSDNRIGDIFDGTREAKAGLDIYAQTRDALLRQHDWGFAERDVALTLLKTAPVGGYTPPLVWSSTYPILPWIYEYAAPADLIKVRSLRTTAVGVPVFDPKPRLFRIANDNTLAPSQKVILANLSNAICVYTAQVTDPVEWDSGFIESLASALARRLAPMLSSNVEVVKEEAQVEGTEMVIGAMERG